MTWTTPITFLPQRNVSAADLNTYFGDNLNALASPPYAYLSHSGSGVTMTTLGTYYAVTWDTEIANVGAMHSTSTNPTQIVASLAGTYHVEATIALNNQAAATYFQVGLFVNGSVMPQSAPSIYVPTAPAASYGVTLSRYVPLAASDYVEIKVKSGTNGLVSTSASGGNRPIVQMRWVGP